MAVIDEYFKELLRETNAFNAACLDLAIVFDREPSDVDQIIRTLSEQSEHSWRAIIREFRRLGREGADFDSIRRAIDEPPRND